MRIHSSMIGALALLLLASSPVLAQDPTALEKENAELRALVERLEGKVDALSTTVEDLQIDNADQASAELDVRIDEMVANMAPVSSGTTKKGYGITFYGFFKLDVAWDTGAVNSGNFARWVTQNGEDQEQLNITARQTRIGFDIDGPEEGDLKVAGKFELDFYNGGAENKAALQMRHAYFTAHWKSLGLTVLAGQTWDVISPLLAPTVQYVGLWWMGDLGFRRPQLRVTKQFDLQDGHNLEGVFAITRNIGPNDILGDSGENGGIPVFQARIEYKGKIIGDNVSRFGIYGHYGQQEYRTAGAGEQDVDTYSFGIYFKVVIDEQWSIQGDGFVGENLGTFVGGIGQSVSLGNPNDPREIGSIGGWLAVTFKATDEFTFNAGISTDDPDNDDLTVGQRSSNFTVFGNGWYQLAPDTRVGMEIMWLETGYFGGGADNSLRIQFSFIFAF